MRYKSNITVLSDTEIESPAGQSSSTPVILPRWLIAAVMIAKDVHRYCTGNVLV